MPGPAAASSAGAVGELAEAAICELCQGQELPAEHRPRARELLGDYLISRAEPCAERALVAVDRVLEAEGAGGAAPLLPTPESLPEARWFTVAGVRLAVWRGDIRRLAVGAVVNAANEGGLGCFQPSHRCIDNVLHRAAGPRLREECRALMARRDGPLAAGTVPLLTSGYHLPAEHVLHVTGPELRPRGRRPTPAEEAQLAACYTGCLQAASAKGLRSLAFCCLSAGLFGYPSDAAAAVALTTVCRWLLEEPARHASFDAIVFDVFTDADEAAYAAAVPKVLSAVDAGV